MQFCTIQDEADRQQNDPFEWQLAYCIVCSIKDASLNNFPQTNSTIDFGNDNFLNIRPALKTWIESFQMAAHPVLLLPPQRAAHFASWWLQILLNQMLNALL